MTKVVDFGYAPGNWLRYARDILSDIHNVSKSKLASKCTLVGSDVIHYTAPSGTFCSQGNVLAKSTHEHIMLILQETTTRRFQHEIGQDPEMVGLNVAFGELSLLDESKIEKSQWEEILSFREFQADVVLSDLGPPQWQTYGFMSNTISLPYNAHWKTPIFKETHPVDLADAALVFCCKNLRKNGSFLVRVPGCPDKGDISVFEDRLKRAFKYVHKWESQAYSTRLPGPADHYFLARLKLDHELDKRAVFGLS